ncbi:hypothetical protein MN608_08467 [Microdochium nivale]|nr:hypothetical protein MN608_08467 [Microdochium nivale]
MEIYGTGPKLATSADWVPWSYHFYLLARHFEVYQYVDPTKTTKHAKEPQMLYYRDLLTSSTETSAGNAAVVVSAPTAAEVVAAAAVTTSMINIAKCKLKDRDRERVEWSKVDERIKELRAWTIITVDNRLLRVPRLLRHSTKRP